MRGRSGQGRGQPGHQPTMYRSCEGQSRVAKPARFISESCCGSEWRPSCGSGPAFEAPSPLPPHQVFYCWFVSFIFFGGGGAGHHMHTTTTTDQSHDGTAGWGGAAPPPRLPAVCRAVSNLFGLAGSSQLSQQHLMLHCTTAVVAIAGLRWRRGAWAAPSARRLRGSWTRSGGRPRRCEDDDVMMMRQAMLDDDAPCSAAAGGGTAIRGPRSAGRGRCDGGTDEGSDGAIEGSCPAAAYGSIDQEEDAGGVDARKRRLVEAMVWAYIGHEGCVHA